MESIGSDEQEINPNLYTTEIVSPSIPPLSRILPLSDENIQILTSDPITHISASEQKRHMRESKTIVMDCGAGGIGDTVMELRIAAGTARKSPDKKVIGVAPHIVGSLPFLHLPVNLELTQTVPISLGADGATHFVHLRDSLTHRMRTWWQSEKDIDAVMASISTNRRYTDLRNSSVHNRNLSLLRHFEKDSGRYNEFDYKSALILGMLGININQPTTLRSGY